MFIIRSKAEPYTYYAGSAWTDQESLAKQYPTQKDAEAVIRKHGMKADAVEASTTKDLDEPQDDGTKSDTDKE